MLPSDPASDPGSEPALELPHGLALPPGGLVDALPAARPVPASTSPYWRFYARVAAAQLAAWAPPPPARVLDLSGGSPEHAVQLAAAGHEVVVACADRAAAAAFDGADPRLTAVVADPRSPQWVASASVDAVVAESRALSHALAAEVVLDELHRVLRPGGRLLLVVESVVSGLARLADQGRWAELADVPSAELLLVPSEDGGITRCFWPEELRRMLDEAGFEVVSVMPRSVLPPAAVEQAVDAGGEAALERLVDTEVRLASQSNSASTGLHLVASAVRR